MADISILDALGMAKIAGNTLTFANSSIVFSGKIIDTQPSKDSVGIVLVSMSERKTRSRFGLTKWAKRTISVPVTTQMSQQQNNCLVFLFRPWPGQGLFKASIHPWYIHDLPKGIH